MTREIGLETYLSPKLGSMQVMSFPLFSARTASLLAATTAAPEGEFDGFTTGKKDVTGHRLQNST